MRCSASIYATKQPTAKVMRTAKPAANRCTLPNYIVVTSPLDASQMLGGCLTMSRHNAMPAIFTDTENSGYLAELLTVESPEELRRLCSSRSKVEATRLASYDTYTSLTGIKQRRTHKERKLLLNHDDRVIYDELRAERFKVMDEVTQPGPSIYTRLNRFRRVNRELYNLTGHHGYFMR